MLFLLYALHCTLYSTREPAVESLWPRGYMRARKNEPLGISRTLTALCWVALRRNLVGVWGSSRRYRNEPKHDSPSRPDNHFQAYLQSTGNEGLTGGGPASNSLASDGGDDRRR